ncbi:MAG TPA: hypothetical protein DHW49_13040 [Anaerolineae bacterium]|nr:hypothetical protein [Anaerolineae bacterium]
MSIYNKKLWDFIRLCLIASICSLLLLIVFVKIQNSDLLDFEIYYEAGRSVLNGEKVYQFYGNYQLPFQYFPWIAWLFAPFAIFDIHTAWILFSLINIFLFFYSIFILLNITEKEVDSNTKITLSLFYLSAALVMSLLLFTVGQISIFLLFLCTVTIKLIDEDKRTIAGILTPVLLLKPHLMLVFFPIVLKKGGKDYLLSSIISIVILGSIATLLNTEWITEMLKIIFLGQLRGDDLLWGYTTFAGAFEMKNWRIINFYFSIPSLIISYFIIHKIRNATTVLYLISGLTLSLFAAPYSFAYDLPLLTPALVLLSSQYKNFSLLIWGIAVIVPIISGFQGQSYFLILIVSILVIFEAKQTLQK